MNVHEQPAYPLAWPTGRPRTHRPQRNISFGPHTIAECVQAIVRNVRMTDADHVVISSNLRLRNDGLPVSGQASPADPGVAVYFHYKERPTCLACDRWDTITDNLRAIVLTLEAMRGLDRWGAADIEATFAGYAAIQPPAGSMWFDVLGVAPNASAEVVKKAYYDQARAKHPDAGGSHEEMIRLQSAYDTWLQIQAQDEARQAYALGHNNRAPR